MKILVLGGNRYFGLRLVRRLLAAGHSVSVLNRSGRAEPGAEALTCDRSDVAALTRTVADRRWDVVVDQVCYDAPTARQACETFSGRTVRYVFTSSLSVYGPGAGLRESDFVPERHPVTRDVTSAEDYSEAKRQAEAVFFRSASFPVAAARFPIVLGADDYTGRLRFHVDRITKGLPIHFPSLDSRLSFIDSEDAAAGLELLCTSDYRGPLNLAATDPITIRALLDEVEAHVGRKAVFVSQPGPEQDSPFGIESDWFMDVSRAEALGFRAASIRTTIRNALRSASGDR